MTTAALCGLAASPVQGQQRLLDARRLSSGVVYESWSFGNVIPGAGSSQVADAKQFTIPFTTVIPLREGWALDSYIAYANGTVTVDRGLGAGREELSVAGVNDVKLRLVGRLHGDNLLLTLGGNVPSGATGLKTRELEAMSVLAAPALRFRTPLLGSGPGGTVGLVYAGEAGPWAVAVGGAFDVRGNFAPGEALSAGVPKPTLRAGNALHVSLGADRVAGPARENVSLILDYYTSGELNDPDADQTRLGFQLGPALTAAYQIQFTTRDVESVIYVLERYRTGFKIGGAEVRDSWRSETELGLLNAMPLGRTASLRLSLDGRFHSANRAAFDDQTLASFAATGIVAGGATLGVQYLLRDGAFALEPFARGQAGKLDLGGPTRSATGLSAGITLSTRF
jgi:hypothetical protein